MGSRKHVTKFPIDVSRAGADYMYSLNFLRKSEVQPYARHVTRHTDSQLHKQVDLWFKEQSFTLGNLNKQRDKIYKYQRRLREVSRRTRREQYARTREEIREKLASIKMKMLMMKVVQKFKENVRLNKEAREEIVPLYALLEQQNGSQKATGASGSNGDISGRCKELPEPRPTVDKGKPITLAAANHEQIQHKNRQHPSDFYTFKCAYSRKNQCQTVDAAVQTVDAESPDIFIEEIDATEAVGELDKSPENGNNSSEKDEHDTSDINNNSRANLVSECAGIERRARSGAYTDGVVMEPIPEECSDGEGHADTTDLNKYSSHSNSTPWQQRTCDASYLNRDVFNLRDRVLPEIPRVHAHPPETVPHLDRRSYTVDVIGDEYLKRKADYLTGHREGGVPRARSQPAPTRKTLVVRLPVPNLRNSEPSLGHSGTLRNNNEADDIAGTGQVERVEDINTQKKTTQPVNEVSLTLTRHQRPPTPIWANGHTENGLLTYPDTLPAISPAVVNTDDCNSKPSFGYTCSCTTQTTGTDGDFTDTQHNSNELRPASSDMKVNYNFPCPRTSRSREPTVLSLSGSETANTDTAPDKLPDMADVVIVGRKASGLRKGHVTPPNTPSGKPEQTSRRTPRTHVQLTHIMQAQKRAKVAEMQEKIHELVRSEPVQTYARTKTGVIKPLTTTPRNSLAAQEPHPMKDQYYRDKLLKQERSTILAQNMKMREFMGTFDREREFAKFAPVTEEAPPVRSTSEPTSTAQKSLGGLLFQVYQPEHQPRKVVPGVTTTSLRLLKHCRYLREYKPIKRERMPTSYGEKVSSWNMTPRSSYTDDSTNNYIANVRLHLT